MNNPGLPNIDEAISASITSKMGDLSGVIGSTQYQAGSPDHLPEGVNLSGVGDPNAPGDIGQYLGNAANPVQTQAPQGVTIPGAGYQQPAPSQADLERQRLEQVAYQASLRAIEAEERAFQAETAGMSEEERRVAQLEREVRQSREVNNWLNTQLDGTVQQQQQANKNQWAILTAHQHGLPIENPGVRAALAQAQSPQHMHAIAQSLAQIARQNQQMAVQSRVNNGIFATGGGIAPTAPQGPKPRSGDLEGLISSRGQIAVNLG